MSLLLISLFEKFKVSFVCLVAFIEELFVWFKAMLGFLLLLVLGLGVTFSLLVLRLWLNSSSSFVYPILFSLCFVSTSFLFLFFRENAGNNLIYLYVLNYIFLLLLYPGCFPSFFLWSSCICVLLLHILHLSFLSSFLRLPFF